MRSAIRFATTLGLIALLVGVLAACASPEPAEVKPLPTTVGITEIPDPSTATLEQVLERSRLAVSDTSDYKKRGSGTWRTSTTEFEKPMETFGEYSSTGNYRDWSTHSHDTYVSTSEWRIVGSQVFHRRSGEDWEEASAPNPERVGPVSNSELFLRALNEPGIELLSTHEITEGGTKVYRLGFSARHENQSHGDFRISNTTTTILVNQESFRIVTWFRDSIDHLYDGLTASDITPGTKYRWVQGIQSEHYYDFNVPVVIEAPNSYIPWTEPVVSN